MGVHLLITLPCQHKNKQLMKIKSSNSIQILLSRKHTFYMEYYYSLKELAWWLLRIWQFSKDCKYFLSNHVENFLNGFCNPYKKMNYFLLKSLNFIEISLDLFLPHIIC